MLKQCIASCCAAPRCPLQSTFITKNLLGSVIRSEAWACPFDTIACTLIFFQRYPRSILPTLTPMFHFCALILIEPLLSPEGIDRLRDLQVSLINGAYERRDVWASRESALGYFRERTEWDARVLDSYVVIHLLWWCVS